MKIVSCRLRIYGFRTSSQRGLARSSSVARRTAEEAIFLCEEGPQKVSKNIEQPLTKSIKNQSESLSEFIQNQFLFIDNFNAFSVHIRRPWTSTRLDDAGCRSAQGAFLIVLHFRVTSLSKAFDAFEYSWSSYEFLLNIVSPHFFHSFLTAEVTLSRTLRSASAYGNASNARRMSQCLQPSGAEVKKEKCNNM